MTTCIFGPLSQSTRSAGTIDVSSWPWSKNGNLAWTISSFANFSIHEKAPSKNLQWTPTLSSDWPLSGVAPNTGSHHRWSKISSPRKDSNIVWNSGPSSTPWDQTQKQDSSNPKCSGPTTEVLPCAMLYDDWPTTFRNHTALFPSQGPLVSQPKPSTELKTVPTKLVP